MYENSEIGGNKELKQILLPDMQKGLVHLFSRNSFFHQRAYPAVQRKLSPLTIDLSGNSTISSSSNEAVVVVASSTSSIKLTRRALLINTKNSIPWHVYDIPESILK